MVNEVIVCKDNIHSDLDCVGSVLNSTPVPTDINTDDYVHTARLELVQFSSPTAVQA